MPLMHIRHYVDGDVPIGYAMRYCSFMTIGLRQPIKIVFR